MDKIEKKIKDILGKNLDKAKFSYFLFGSRVKGDYKRNSDYDIGVYGKQKLDFQKYLRLKRELNDNINYPIDFVDFNRVGKDFRNLAFKNIKLWNHGKNINLIEKN